jgi:hypothetical protein
MGRNGTEGAACHPVPASRIRRWQSKQYVVPPDRALLFQQNLTTANEMPAPHDAHRWPDGGRAMDDWPPEGTCERSPARSATDDDAALV